MYQLVNKQVWIHNNNCGLINPNNFKKLVGVKSPEQFVDYLSLLGDSSDNIPGVRGMGEVKCIEFMNKWGSINNFATLGTKEKMYDKIIEATGLSKSLIDLAWFNKYKLKEKLDESFYYKGEKKPKKRVGKYRELCERFGINKFAKDEYIDKIP